MISKNETKNTVILYVSDHGESLGEDDKWLHAFEHETLHNAACFIWMSEKYKKKHKFTNAIKQNQNKETNTSSIFHTLLQCANIRSNILDYKESLTSINYSISEESLTINHVTK